MIVLFAARTSSLGGNKMRMSATKVHNVPVLVPSSRRGMIFKAFKNQIVDIKGDKESIARIKDVFATNDVAIITINPFALIFLTRTKRLYGISDAAVYLVEMQRPSVIPQITGVCFPKSQANIRR